MNQSVKWLNELSATDAEAELLKCCGSTRWARDMTQARPFASVEKLCETADAVCATLNDEDWIEAFHAHPKIGERKAATDQSRQAQTWSAQEQSAVAQASSQTKDSLAKLNQEYEARFGFIFIVCAAGKSSEEILEFLNERLQNDRETELKIAAEEQRKITALRLRKLIKE